MKIQKRTLQNFRKYLKSYRYYHYIVYIETKLLRTGNCDDKFNPVTYSLFLTFTSGGEAFHQDFLVILKQKPELLQDISRCYMHSDFCGNSKFKPHQYKTYIL